MSHHRSLAFSVAIAILAGCADDPTSIPTDAPNFAVAGVGHRATGSAHVQGSDGLREFTFNAVEHQNGSVSGGYKVVLPNGLFIESDATCVTVAGNTAWVGGVIRASNSAAVVIGSTSMFHVVDNGEGAGADPDIVSILAFNRIEGADQNFCANQLIEFPELTVTNGNVQVR